MNNISKTSCKASCERLYFRSTPIYLSYPALLPWFTSFSFPCSELCKYQRYWIFELLHFQTLCLVWLGKRVTALKGAVSLASTQHRHEHNVQQQTVSWAVWQRPPQTILYNLSLKSIKKAKNRTSPASNYMIWTSFCRRNLLPNYTAAQNNK